VRLLVGGTRRCVAIGKITMECSSTPCPFLAISRLFTTLLGFIKQFCPPTTSHICVAAVSLNKSF
jgi:hypothetical protein